MTRLLLLNHLSLYHGKQNKSKVVTWTKTQRIGKQTIKHNGKSIGLKPSLNPNICKEINENKYNLYCPYQVAPGPLLIYSVQSSWWMKKKVLSRSYQFCWHCSVSLSRSSRGIWLASLHPTAPPLLMWGARAGRRRWIQLELQLRQKTRPR